MSSRLRLQPAVAGQGMNSQRVRDRLVERLREAGIRDEDVLNAVRTVPRHLFVDEALAMRAYEDTALPIGHGQTISQPWVVARMTEVLLAQGKSAVEAVRTIGVTEQTYYRWRSEYGGLKLDQVKRLKVLEQENGRLRRAVADLTLEKLVLKEAASGNW